jgi:hypothetical protein
VELDVEQHSNPAKRYLRVSVRFLFNTEKSREKQRKAERFSQRVKEQKREKREKREKNKVEQDSNPAKRYLRVSIVFLFTTEKSSDNNRTLMTPINMIYLI